MASTATQMTRVFCRKDAWTAVCAAVARARPSKKRMNGTLPPMMAIAARPSHCFAPLGRVTVALARCPMPTTASRTTAATMFFAVVYSEAFPNALTPKLLR